MDAQLRQALKETLLEVLEQRPCCPYSLKDIGITAVQHKQHHLFLQEVMCGLQKVKTTVLATVVTTIIGALLSLLWFGFKAT